MAQTIATFDISGQPSLRHGLFVLLCVDFDDVRSKARFNKFPEFCCGRVYSIFS